MFLCDHIATGSRCSGLLLTLIGYGSYYVTSISFLNLNFLYVLVSLCSKLATTVHFRDPKRNFGRRVIRGERHEDGSGKKKKKVPEDERR